MQLTVENAYTDLQMTWINVRDSSHPAPYTCMRDIPMGAGSRIEWVDGKGLLRTASIVRVENVRKYTDGLISPTYALRGRGQDLSPRDIPYGTVISAK